MLLLRYFRDLYGGDLFSTGNPNNVLRISEILVHKDMFYAPYQESSGSYCKAYSMSSLEGFQAFAGIDSFSLVSVIDAVFFSKHAGVLSARDAETGEMLWENTGATLPAGEPGAIYFHDGTNFCRATPRTGNVIHQTPGASPSFSPAIGEETVVFATATQLIGLEKETFAGKWTYSLSSALVYRPVISKDGLYFSYFRGNLYALDMNTGTQIWTKSGAFTHPIVANNMLYVYQTIDSTCYVEAYTGQEPTARVEKPLVHVQGGEEFALNATNSFAAPGRAISSYSWDMGDGNTNEGVTVTHTYPVTGALTTYSVTLTVTDDAGKTGTETLSVEVTPPDDSLHLAQSSSRFYYDMVRTGEDALVLFYNDANNNLVYRSSTNQSRRHINRTSWYSSPDNTRHKVFN